MLAAFVSPYREDRDKVRTLLEAGDQLGDNSNEEATSSRRKNFIEVYVEADLSVCGKSRVLLVFLTMLPLKLLKMQNLF